MRGENGSTRRKPRLSVICISQISRGLILRSNPGLRGERLAANNVTRRDQEGRERREYKEIVRDTFDWGPSCRPVVLLVVVA